MAHEGKTNGHKANVQKAHPGAFCSRENPSRPWLVCKRTGNRNQVIGQGTSAKQAWFNADWKIRSAKHSQLSPKP